MLLRLARFMIPNMGGAIKRFNVDRNYEFQIGKLQVGRMCRRQALILLDKLFRCLVKLEHYNILIKPHDALRSPGTYMYQHLFCKIVSPLDRFDFYSNRLLTQE